MGLFSQVECQVVTLLLFYGAIAAICSWCMPKGKMLQPYRVFNHALSLSLFTFVACANALICTLLPFSPDRLMGLPGAGAVGEEYKLGGGKPGAKAAKPMSEMEK